MKAPLLADPRLWGWLAIAVAIVGLVSVLSPILAPFLAGAILAYILNPLVGRLTGRYLPRLVAVALVLLFALALVVAFALVVLPLFVKELRLMAERVVQGRSEVGAATRQLDAKVDAILAKRRWLLERAGRA